MSAAFAAAIEPMRAQLLALIRECEALREAHSSAPVDGSIGQAERKYDATLAGSWGSHPVTSAQNWAWFLVILAEMHMQSVADLVVLERAVVYSPQVLARAALEALGRALWMGEPALGARERVARWETERLYSSAQVAMLGMPPEKPERLKQTILETADKLNFSKMRARKNTPARLVNRPSGTELVKRLMLDTEKNELGATLYRAYSATTHGTLYALAQNIEATGAADPEGQILGAVGVSSREVSQVLGMLVWGYALAVNRLIVLYGYPTEDWAKSAENALNLVHQQVVAPTAKG